MQCIMQSLKNNFKKVCDLNLANLLFGIILVADWKEVTALALVAFSPWSSNSYR